MELKVRADLDHLNLVMEFITGELKKNGFGEKQVYQVELAAEEIFTNIATYAYQSGSGDVWIQCQARKGHPETFMITFMDEGIPYNPLDRADPDITAGVEERQIGGLGIFLTKKMMDTLEYQYKDGKNILYIMKQKDEG